MDNDVAEGKKGCHTKSNAEVDEQPIFNKDLDYLITNLANDYGFDDSQYAIEKKTVCNKGENFLGILYEVNIIGKKKNEAKKMHLFVKIAIGDENIKEEISIHDVYCREIFAYNEIAKLFNHLQTTLNIPDSERLHLAKCYGVLINNHAETIVLENLKYRGFEVEDRFKCITLEYAEAAIRNLAAFHGLSYILEKREPLLFQNIIMDKKEQVFSHNETRNTDKLMEFTVKNAEEALHKTDYKNKVKKYIEKMYKDRLVDKHFLATKRSVLCHGDYRINNIMVKYEEEKITALIPVDLQLAHYGPPLNDLFYFIFGGTNQMFRRDHLEYLIQYYYNSLADFLKFDGLDINDVYPKKEFDVDVHERLEFGLVTSINILPFILISTEEAPDLSNSKEQKQFTSGMKYGGNDIYKSRFNEIIDDFVNWGYI